MFVCLSNDDYLYIQPLANVFNIHASPSTATKTNQQSGSIVDTGDLFLTFTTTAPMHTVNTNMFVQPTQQTSFVYQQQPNSSGLISLTPIAPPTATNSFDDLFS
ncbi:unnamed protein product [Rotaria sp. Silwood1]|nr:unnamed protein product [Rotaria sp. Silwood1]CAF1109983.1 unnamed protein product [Rotaria sp. Silwood1]